MWPICTPDLEEDKGNDSTEIQNAGEVAHKLAEARNDTETSDSNETSNAKEMEKSPLKLRCSNRTINEPKYLEDFIVLALNAEAYIEDILKSFDDIRGRDDKEDWYRDVDEEIKALEKNDTWVLTELPEERRPIDAKWLFKIKRNDAFLHGNLKEEIYMKIPEGFTEKPGLVCKLMKTLYRLKQAPRAWNEKFDTYVRSLGMKRSDIDKCLYIYEKGSAKIFLIVYVDDLIIVGNSEFELEKIKIALTREFSMTDLGELNFFFGIKIERKEGGMYLSQTAYLKNVLKRFNMENCKPSKTPMEVKPPAKEDSTKCIIGKKPFRELVGCLMYVMLTTRPDTSAAVNFYSRLQSNATETHWTGLKRILRYIRGTANMSLYYQKNVDDKLIGYADADWAGDKDRKSTSGFLFKVYGELVCCSTRKQSTVALSSTEAGYVALASASMELT